MAPLPRESIALITYTPEPAEEAVESGLRYASGFFTKIAHYGEVCVTCAHVVNDHPGPNREALYVNGIETEVCFNAWPTLGIDVALLAITPELRESGIHFHKLGASSSLNRIYYTHAWNIFRAQPGAVEFSKVWGPRFSHDSHKLVRRGAKMYATWRLRNDVFDLKSGRKFSTKNFAPGWSGSPVFNVRKNIDEHCVIGVLSVVAQEEGEALAVSIEKLDFLRPVEVQSEEAWYGRAPENLWHKAAVWLRLRTAEPRYIVRYDDGSEERQLYHVRYSEITGQPVCPPMPEPASPYDIST